MTALVETAPTGSLIGQSTVRGAFDSVVVNPLEHPKWDALLIGHSGKSFFHSSSWARVLNETYGHKPAYICRFEDGQLKQLLAIMEVSSPLTGRRGVSLPFSDFCPPLTTKERDLGPLLKFAMGKKLS